MPDPDNLEPTKAMTIPTFHVDLDQPPEHRWRGIETHKAAAEELLSYYVNDLGGLEQFDELLITYRDAFVQAQYATEMRAIAKCIGRPEAEVLLSNLYYDAIKHLFGCTAFAVDTPDGPLHARNLDWGTVNQMLSRHTLQVEYSRNLVLNEFNTQFLTLAAQALTLRTFGAHFWCSTPDTSSSPAALRRGRVARVCWRSVRDGSWPLLRYAQRGPE